MPGESVCKYLKTKEGFARVPPPGCFVQSVCNRLKMGRLSFWGWPKSSQEYQNKGLDRFRLSAVLEQSFGRAWFWLDRNGSFSAQVIGFVGFILPCQSNVTAPTHIITTPTLQGTAAGTGTAVEAAAVRSLMLA